MQRVAKNRYLNNSRQNEIPLIYKSFSSSQHVALDSTPGDAICYLHGGLRAVDSLSNRFSGLSYPREVLCCSKFCVHIHTDMSTAFYLLSDYINVCHIQIKSNFSDLDYNKHTIWAEGKKQNRTSLPLFIISLPCGILRISVSQRKGFAY